MSEQSKYWAVIPAAGVGRRMRAEVPKQYLKIQDRTILEHALAHFCQHPSIELTVVALAGSDEIWPGLDIAAHPKVKTVAGGAERCHSVLNGVRFLQQTAQDDDWVLVHDAARPCISRRDIDTLITHLAGHPVGGLLATPVRDTLKRAGDDGQVMDTVERQGMWQALTPQMFRFATLLQALRQCLSVRRTVTDEAQAIEYLGLHPVVVEGAASNIKITSREDLALAEFFFARQGSG